MRLERTSGSLRFRKREFRVAVGYLAGVLILKLKHPIIGAVPHLHLFFFFDGLLLVHWRTWVYGTNLKRLVKYRIFVQSTDTLYLHTYKILLLTPLLRRDRHKLTASSRKYCITVKPHYNEVQGSDQYFRYGRFSWWWGMVNFLCAEIIHPVASLEQGLTVRGCNGVSRVYLEYGRIH